MKIATFFLLSLLVLEPISITSLSIKTERTALALYNSKEKKKIETEEIIIFVGNFITGVLCFWFGPLEVIRDIVEETFGNENDQKCYYKNIHDKYLELKESIEKEQKEKREALLEEKELQALEPLEKEEEQCSKEKQIEYEELEDRINELQNNYREAQKKIKEYNNGKLTLTDIQFNDLQISAKILEESIKKNTELASAAEPRGCIKYEISKGLNRFKKGIQKKIDSIKDYLEKHLKAAWFIAKRGMKCLKRRGGKLLDKLNASFVKTVVEKILNFLTNTNPAGVIISKLKNLYGLLLDIRHLIQAIDKKSTKDIGFYLGKIVGKIIGGLLPGGKRKLRKIK